MKDLLSNRDALCNKLAKKSKHAVQWKSAEIIHPKVNDMITPLKTLLENIAILVNSYLITRWNEFR